MLIARAVGKIPVVIGSILFAILGIVLILIGATASPAGTGRMAIGAALVVGAALLVLDAVTGPDGT